MPARHWLSDMAEKIGRCRLMIFIMRKARIIRLYLNKEETACYAKMKDVDQLLQGKFFRIHKGYLVNLMHIGRYTRTEVQLDNGEKLPLSKYRYPAFTDAYMGYLSGEDKQERRIQGSNSDHILKNAETDA